MTWVTWLAPTPLCCWWGSTTSWFRTGIVISLSVQLGFSCFTECLATKQNASAVKERSLVLRDNNVFFFFFSGPVEISRTRSWTKENLTASPAPDFFLFLYLGWPPAGKILHVYFCQLSCTALKQTSQSLPHALSHLLLFSLCGVCGHAKTSGQLASEGKERRPSCTLSQRPWPPIYGISPTQLTMSSFFIRILFLQQNSFSFLSLFSEVSQLDGQRSKGRQLIYCFISQNKSQGHRWKIQ